MSIYGTELLQRVFFAEAYIPDNWEQLILTAELQFTRPDGLKSTGKFVSVPILPEGREYLTNYGVFLPANIQGIDYLTLAPQETLPPDQRIMSLPANYQFNNYNGIAVSQPLSWDNHYGLFYNGKNRPYMPLARLIRIATPKNQYLEIFHQQLTNSPASKVLILQGHSWVEPWELGEKYAMHTDGTTHPRNAVSVDQLLNNFNHPNQYAAICIIGCKQLSEATQGYDIPVFHSSREQSWAEFQTGNLQGHCYLPPQY